MPHWAPVPHGDGILSICHWKMTLKAPVVREVFVWVIQTGTARQTDSGGPALA